MSDVIAWHYTTTAGFESIAASGFLWPATAGIVPSERPVAWFSLHPKFEPTAFKATLDPSSGKRRRLTWEEMRGLGPYRLGLKPRQLLCGDTLRRAARISTREWRVLRDEGFAQGANPDDWFGHVGPVPLARLTVQVLGRGCVWNTACERLMAA